MAQDNIFCNFIEIDYSTYICEFCEVIVRSEYGPPFLPCSARILNDRTNQHGMPTKIKNFTKSLVRHVPSGSRLCSDDTIQKRFDICKLCELFDAKKSVCKECGCSLKATHNFLNKLAWADEECPIGKWFKEI